MQITTLVIAILGLVTAVAALGWNILSWLLSGARTSVMLTVAVDGPAGLMAVAPRAAAIPEYKEVLAATGYDRWMIGVTVTNSGRASVRLTQWTIEFRSTPISWFPGALAVGPEFPYVLEAGNQQTWVVDIQHVIELTEAATKKPRGIAAVVTLGTGRIIKSRTFSDTVVHRIFQ